MKSHQTLLCPLLQLQAMLAPLLVALFLLCSAASSWRLGLLASLQEASLFKSRSSWQGCQQTSDLSPQTSQHDSPEKQAIHLRPWYSDPSAGQMSQGPPSSSGRLGSSWAPFLRLAGLRSLFLGPIGWTGPLGAEPLAVSGLCRWGFITCSLRAFSLRPGLRGSTSRALHESSLF